MLDWTRNSSLLRLFATEHYFSDSTIVLPLGLSSDQTCLTNRVWGGSASAYPFYLSPLNMKDRNTRPVYVLGYLELPSSATLNLYKPKERIDLKTAVYHRALRAMMYPFSKQHQDRNDGGCYLMNISLYNISVIAYPTIAMGMQDMAEAWRLKCLIQWQCDVCGAKGIHLLNLGKLPPHYCKANVLEWLDPKR